MEGTETYRSMDKESLPYSAFSTLRVTVRASLAPALICRTRRAWEEADQKIPIKINIRHNERPRLSARTRRLQERDIKRRMMG